MEHKRIKLAENLSNFHQFEENRMDFDDTIVSQIDDTTFPRNILKKAFESELLFDVTLITEADSTSISAHRMVLAAASEYFLTMFTTDMMERNQKEIKIKEVTGESLKSLVNYCYTGQLEINSRNVLNLLASASLMRFERIEDECKEFFEKQLEAHPKSGFSILLFAEKYSFTELARKCLKNICENFDIFSKTIEFNEIDFNVMQRILDSDERFNATEEKIFEAAMKWVDFDRSERQQFIRNILKLIRLTQIDTTYLFENVQPICESNNCTDLLIPVVNWHTLPEPKRLGLLPVKQTTKRAGLLKMLVIGGNRPSNVISMESYCPRTKKWSLRDQIKFPTSTFGSRLAVIDETVYVTGNRVFCFDLHTLKLSPLPPMSVARRYHDVAVLNNDLYVIGGSGCNINNRVLLSSVERYDSSQIKWNNCAPMSKAKSSVSAAVLNGYLYVIGGYNDSSRKNSIERYSPSNDTWSFVKPMNNSRINPGVGVLNGKIYVIGGCNSNSHGSVEYYDPITDIWTTIASLSTPRTGVSVAVYENELFAIGGVNTKKQFLSVVERYNENEDKWTTIEPLNCPRKYSRVIIIRK